MKSEKLTRWYNDACGTARALELLGERWAMLVVRELMFGPRRFGELRGGLPGISANILTQRLAGLEAAGVLRRRHLPPPANAQVYELTPWGYESEPIMQALGRWAARSPDHDPTLPFSAASAMMSLRTMLDVGKARSMTATIGFRFGTDSFVARLANGELPIARSDEPTDVTLDTDPVTMAALVYGKWPLAEAEAAGAVRVTGDRVTWDRFVTLFALPSKVSVE
jgi:DNA-binding HxlR family transcriptional regulator